MKPVRTTGIIRQRGQLTIPGAIRKAVKWAKSFCAVSIALEDPETIVIRPHKEGEGAVDWDWIYKEMEVVRSFRGEREQKESLSEFIARDRWEHR